MKDAISLSEKLYLLSIYSKKGGTVFQPYSAMDYLLIGALLMELYLENKIRFERKRVVVLTTKADLQLHRFILQKIDEAKSPRKIITWLNRFYYSSKSIEKEVQKGLVSKSLIRLQSKHFLFIKWEKPRLDNKQAVFNLVKEIENHIFKGTLVDEELVLLSFIEPGALLYRLFPERTKRREARRKLRAIIIERRVSDAVANVVAAAQMVAKRL